MSTAGADADRSAALLPGVSSVSTPVVSLVICTRGRSDRLSATATRARAALDGCVGPDGPLLAELVLVDNGTPSEVEKELSDDVRADPRVRVVNAQVPGLSRARAVGCAASRGDIVVMTDDDVEVDAGWLGRMASPVLRGQGDLVAGRVRLAADTRYPVDARLRRWLAETDDDGEPHVVGAALAFRRDVLGAALWDPALGAGAPGTGFGEDVLFEWMAVAHGARLVRAGGPPVIHRPDVDRLTRAAWIDAAVRRGRSDAYVAHHWLGTKVSFGGARWVRLAVLLAAHRLRGRVRSAAAAPTTRAVDPEELELVRRLAQSRALHGLRRAPRLYLRA
ncbi:glycosyltransferase [Isoptericola sp. NPDC019482]|uniref:glycosyltransferase family 2 protein n=1 Tax=Isoptericola sp. NPDC019482 TaxID=3154688 RepID=UPI003488E152